MSSAFTLQEAYTKIVQELQKHFQVTSQETSALICQMVFSTRCQTRFSSVLHLHQHQQALAVTGHYSLH